MAETAQCRVLKSLSEDYILHYNPNHVFYPNLGLVLNAHNHNTDYKAYGTGWYRI